ncbi:hypothetical protein RR48_12370 [Papilio machaon]|uniref:Uncharacterized protein n=1 Tax=Papilio machaon TaxID=76193 RepID=A0A194QT20_PAPMA|nr:hypothetical protein RR48_12370 [Papilio machaon]
MDARNNIGSTNEPAHPVQYNDHTEDIHPDLQPGPGSMFRTTSPPAEEPRGGPFQTSPAAPCGSSAGGEVVRNILPGPG